MAEWKQVTRANAPWLCATTTAMAFPIPTHLPRRSDSSSSLSVINKLESATHKTLTATLAGSWTRELENDITTTKVR